MKGMEIFWMVFSTLVFGVIIGAFGVTVPVMLIFGVEFSANLGLISTAVGALVYRGFAYLKRKK